MHIERSYFHNNFLTISVRHPKSIFVVASGEWVNRRHIERRWGGMNEAEGSEGEWVTLIWYVFSFLAFASKPKTREKYLKCDRLQSTNGLGEEEWMASWKVTLFAASHKRRIRHWIQLKRLFRHAKVKVNHIFFSCFSSLFTYEMEERMRKKTGEEKFRQMNVACFFPEEK